MSEALARHASAAMDISDGLALDLSRMCAASRVCRRRGVLNTSIGGGNRRFSGIAGSISAILSGGDDYEILCAVPADRTAAFETASGGGGVPVTRIGIMKAGERAPAFIQADGTSLELPVEGFQHFTL